MSATIFIIASILYISLLFAIAYFSDRLATKGRSLVANPYIYALSMAVYCTGWTFYGSVGKAAASGASFFPIYLGPTIFAPLWLLVIRKMIFISKSQRITSIADFISSRYGKSAFLGSLVTIVAIVGIIPYISLQLKAIAGSFDVLMRGKEAFLPQNTEGSPLFYSTAFYVTILLSVFSILFGTRNLEPNERHEGMITAVAFESLVKLLCFLAVGIYVTYGIFGGFSNLFDLAAANPHTAKLMNFSDEINGSEWFWLSLLSFFAVILLPRQFHVAVVENSNPNYVARAMWLFPLYLLLINIFVLPIACAGLMQLDGTGFRPDNFVLGLPLAYGQGWLALVVFIGGLSAATGMVIVEVTALSIMTSNHLIMPSLIPLITQREADVNDFSKILIAVRRVGILLILLLAFAYVRTIATDRPLVSIGLVSFAAVTQFAPALFGGLFWKRATKAGAIWGILTGFLIWLITLPIPTLAEVGLIKNDILTNGYFGQHWLRPYELFGLRGYDHISHAAFWSLLFNTFVFVIVSLNTRQSAMEASQADYFVNIYKYLNVGSEFEVLKREAKIEDLVFLLNRFLGEERTHYLLKMYEEENHINLSKITKANAELVNYVETLLAGAIGASSAKILMASVVKEDPISIDEMLTLLDQTQEIVLTNRALERKSQELEATTKQLQEANKQLKELDRLKADFITTVTHELRTPMTSLKALSKILLDKPNIAPEKRTDFLKIMVSETERITRLVNQVLDIEKLQSGKYEWNMEQLDLVKLVKRTYDSLIPVFEEQNIDYQYNISTKKLLIEGDNDRLTQVLVNLISNAIKFCKKTSTNNALTEGGGEVHVSLEVVEGKAILKVSDNGIGIEGDKQKLIFERFTQINNPTMGKPHGSGLGLFITRRIVEHHRGSIYVESTSGEGATFVIELPILS